MKINTKNSQNNIPIPKNGYHPIKQDKLKKYHNKPEINTTRPAQAISFSGSVVSLSAQLGEKLSSTAIESKSLNKLVDKVYDNEAAFNAVYSLLIAGILKPLFVLNMPGSEEKDKQIVATKNFLQAFIGFFLGYTIGGGLIKKSIDTVKNNLKLLTIDKSKNITSVSSESKKALEVAKDALIKDHSNLKDKISHIYNATKQADASSKVSAFKQALKEKVKYEPSIDEISQKAKEMVENLNKNHIKYFKKNTSFVEELLNRVKIEKSGTILYDAFETFWKNSTGAITAIGKAKISSVLLPGVMAFLFAKKNQEKEKQKLIHSGITLTNNTAFKNEQDKFKSIMEDNSRQNKNISFKGKVLNKPIDFLATVIENAAMSKPGEKAAKKLAFFKKPSPRMGDLESGLLTAYWVQNTIRSKKIEPSQKLGLNVHTVLVTLVSSGFAFIIDWALDGLIESSEKAYSAKLKNIAQETLKKHKELIKNGPKNSLNNAPGVIQIAVEDACKNLLDNKIKIDDSVLNNTIEQLKESKTIKSLTDNGFNLDKKLLKETIESLRYTEPVKKTIKEKAKNMLGSEKIAKELSKIDLFDKSAIEQTAESLSKNYFKKLSKCKSLIVFTFVVRFLVPVLMVPVSGRLKKNIAKLMEDRKKEKELKKK